jgi:hypothetical protein
MCCQVVILTLHNAANVIKHDQVSHKRFQTTRNKRWADRNPMISCSEIQNRIRGGGVLRIQKMDGPKIFGRSHDAFDSSFESRLFAVTESD